MVLVKTLESPLDSKQIKPVNKKSVLNIPWENWCWSWSSSTFTAENWLLGKDPDAGKDWRQEKGMTENEMVGWHHWLDGYEFEQVPGVGVGQGSLACCSPWGRKESDTTEQLNCAELNWMLPKPTWLHTPGCVALGEWLLHGGYLSHKSFSLQFVCVFLPPLVNLFCFC